MKKLATSLCMFLNILWFAACGGDDNRCPAGTTCAPEEIVAGPLDPRSPCKADQLCLQVKPTVAGQTPRSGRLVVVWTQINDDFDFGSALQIGHDAAFDGSVARIDIPLNQLNPPDDDKFLTCERDYDLCPRSDVDSGPRDITKCPCQPGLQLSFANVLLIDHEHALDPAELETVFDNGVLIGDSAIYVIRSDKAFTTTEMDQQSYYPGNVSRSFPKGIAAGVQPYRMYDEAIDGPNDDAVDGFPLYLAPGQVFDLQVCTRETATCKL